MTWFALWLLAVGVMDLVRSAVPRHEIAPAAGAVVLAVGAWVTGMTAWVDVLALAASMVPMLGWLWSSERAQGQRGRHHLLALGSLVLGSVGLFAFSGWASAPTGPLATWLAWADLPLVGGDTLGVGATGALGHGLPWLLLVLALLVVNVATANILVRLVLVSVGALRPGSGSPQPADRLRGGRLLGPMERLLILGLGLAGQLTAAGLVIAAKGLIRFPELNSRAKDGSGVDGVGIDEVTEYFLIGSFVSWLIALGSLALTR